VRQLELPLWEVLKDATALPELANLPDLWASLDSALVPLATSEQLEVAGDALVQIAEIIHERSLLAFEEIDSVLQEEGPILAEDFFDRFVRQSMQVDFEQFIEPPSRLPRLVTERDFESSSEDNQSLAGEVDKAALLSMVDELERELNEAELTQQVQELAHDEPIGEWVEMIRDFLSNRPAGEAISFVELQRSLSMPRINLWLGLLHAQEFCQLYQQGWFYDPDTLQIKRMSISI
jgi:hypothetical protein